MRAPENSGFFNPVIPTKIPHSVIPTNPEMRFKNCHLTIFRPGFFRFLRTGGRHYDVILLNLKEESKFPFLNSSDVMMTAKSAKYEIPVDLNTIENLTQHLAAIWSY